MSPSNLRINGGQFEALPELEGLHVLASVFCVARHGQGNAVTERQLDALVCSLYG
jgi:putative hemolysin